MESLTWTGYAPAALVTIALVLLFNHLFNRNRKYNLPPGPKPWPIIGNFDLIGELPHRSLDKLSKKYGPIMSLRYGSVPVVVGSSVEMARLFLQTHDFACCGRPKLAAGKYTTQNYSNMGWSQYDPYLRQARKLCFMQLFSAKRLASYEHLRIEELNWLLKKILQHKGSEKPVLVNSYLTNLNLNVISRIVLGRKYVDEGDQSSILQFNEFRDILDEFFFLNGVLNLGDWIPCLKFLDVQGYEKRMKTLARNFDRLLEHALVEHRARRKAEGENWVPRDTLDVLLELEDDPSLEVKLGANEIKGLTQDLIVGGTETSATTIEWAMSELLRQPEIIAKAAKELDDVIGRERWVRDDDMKNLPYFRAIVKETMRLHPAAPTLLPHYAREDIKIHGYDIPKGTVVFVSVFSAQRDPKIYERPEDFWPERFIGRDIDLKGQDFELLPFGSGRRMCPGYSLGLKIVQDTLANLIHGFTWKLPNNMKPEDLNMEETYRLSGPKKIPLAACAEPRLAPQLYEFDQA